MAKIKLGDKVRDVYTKFTGIVVARSQWLHGCDRFLVEPEKLDKDGKLQEAQWFDEPRVELVKSQPVKVAKVSRDRRPGGPRPDPSGSRAGER